MKITEFKGLYTNHDSHTLDLSFHKDCLNVKYDNGFFHSQELVNPSEKSEDLLWKGYIWLDEDNQSSNLDRKSAQYLVHIYKYSWSSSNVRIWELNSDGSLGTLHTGSILTFNMTTLEEWVELISEDGIARIWSANGDNKVIRRYNREVYTTGNTLQTLNQLFVTNWLEKYKPIDKQFGVELEVISDLPDPISITKLNSDCTLINDFNSKAIQYDPNDILHRYYLIAVDQNPDTFPQGAFLPYNTNIKDDYGNNILLNVHYGFAKYKTFIIDGVFYSPTDTVKTELCCAVARFSGEIVGKPINIWQKVVFFIEVDGIYDATLTKRITNAEATLNQVVLQKFYSFKNIDGTDLGGYIVWSNYSFGFSKVIPVVDICNNITLNTVNLAYTMKDVIGFDGTNEVSGFKYLVTALLDDGEYLLDYSYTKRFFSTSPTDNFIKINAYNTNPLNYPDLIGFRVYLMVLDINGKDSFLDYQLYADIKLTKDNLLWGEKRGYTSATECYLDSLSDQGIYFTQNLAYKYEGKDPRVVSVTDYTSSNNMGYNSYNGKVYRACIGGGRVQKNNFYLFNNIPTINPEYCKGVLFLGNDLGIIQEERVEFIKVDTIEDQFVYSYRGDFPYKVVDYINLGSESVFLCSHGIYYANSLQPVLLSENINNIIRDRYENMRIGYSRKKNELYVIDMMEIETQEDEIPLNPITLLNWMIEIVEFRVSDDIQIGTAIPVLNQNSFPMLFNYLGDITKYIKYIYFTLDPGVELKLDLQYLDSNNIISYETIIISNSIVLTFSKYKQVKQINVMQIKNGNTIVYPPPIYDNLTILSIPSPNSCILKGTTEQVKIKASNLDITGTYKLVVEGSDDIVFLFTPKEKIFSGVVSLNQTYEFTPLKEYLVPKTIPLTIRLQKLENGIYISKRTINFYLEICASVYTSASFSFISNPVTQSTVYEGTSISIGINGIHLVEGREYTARYVTMQGFEETDLSSAVGLITLNKSDNSANGTLIFSILDDDIIEPKEFLRIRIEVYEDGVLYQKSTFEYFINPSGTIIVPPPLPSKLYSAIMYMLDLERKVWTKYHIFNNMNVKGKPQFVHLNDVIILLGDKEQELEYKEYSQVTGNFSFAEFESIFGEVSLLKRLKAVNLDAELEENFKVSHKNKKGETVLHRVNTGNYKDVRYFSRLHNRIPSELIEIMVQGKFIIKNMDIILDVTERI
jgi:hypothetical protein